MKELFIMSFQRSGSNWLHRCLKAYPDFYINGELNVSGNLAKLSKIRTGDHVSNKLLTKNNIFKKASQDYIRCLMRENLRDVYDIDNTDIKYIADKTAFPGLVSLRKHPEQYDYISYLKSYFPDAKQILLIRDIRDVIVSYSEWKLANTINLLSFSPRSFVLYIRALYNWCELHERWLKEMKSESNCLVIQYTDLKDDFTTTMETVFKFLELDVDSEFMTELHNDYYSIDSKVYKEENEKRNYAFFRSGTIGGWRNKYKWFHKLVIRMFFYKRIEAILKV